MNRPRCLGKWMVHSGYPRVVLPIISLSGLFMDIKHGLYFVAEVRITLRNLLQTFLAPARVAQISVIFHVGFTHTMF